jgi:HPt (histidine-containing phosphotransfer) domain-containing protein
MSSSYFPAWENLRSERFDPLALWQRVGEDMRLLREVVQIFARESPQMLHRMEEAIESKDGGGLQKVAHKLRGSLLQFAAPAALSVATDLEKSASRMSLEKSLDRISIEEAKFFLNKLRAEIDALMQALRTMTSQV